MKAKLTILAIFFSTFSYSQSIVSVTPNSVTAGGVTETISIVGNLTYWNTGAGIYYIKLIGNNDTINMLSLNIIDDTHIECSFLIPTMVNNGCYDVQAFDLIADTVTLSCGMTITGGLSSITEEDSAPNGIIIYPNPTKGKITIECEGMKKIEVLDVTGMLVYELVVSSDFVDIDISGFSKGIYLVKVSSEDGVGVEGVVRY